MLALETNNPDVNYSPIRISGGRGGVSRGNIAQYTMAWIGLAQVVDACECGNEPSGSVKCGEFLD